MTVVNQIAEFVLNKDSSAGYFEALWQVYYGGTQTPVTPPIDCLCPTEIEVPAALDPVDGGYASGFIVQSGLDYDIAVSGTWNGGLGAMTGLGQDGVYNALAYAPALNMYSLVFRVGLTGAWLPAYEGAAYLATVTGEVYFAMNDVPGTYTDNTGSLTVSIVLVE
jgi:hypothetical protein